MKNLFSIALFLSMYINNQPEFFGQDKSSRNQDWLTQLQTIKKKGVGAFTNEMDREKAGDCPSAMTTYDQGMCLQHEIEQSTSNYQTYLHALREIDALNSADNTSPGLTGKSLSVQARSKEFDDVERAWQIFQKAQCSLAYDEYKGGSIAPIMQLTCELRLMRDRMRQLESIYDISH